MTDRRTKMIHELAGTNPADAEAYRTMAQAFRQIADGPIDTGAGMGAGADFWLTIAGVEYFVTASRSRKQARKDGPDLSDDPDEAVFGPARPRTKGQQRGEYR